METWNHECGAQGLGHSERQAYGYLQIPLLLTFKRKTMSPNMNPGGCGEDLKLRCTFLPTAEV